MAADEHGTVLRFNSLPPDCSMIIPVSKFAVIRSLTLHILGCGNPISMTLFSYAGADSFDSVDWSRWTINPKTLQFADLDHLPLINCQCKICKRKKLDPISRTLLHNLLFYKKFMDNLRSNIAKNNGLEFLDDYLDRKILSKIVKFF